MVEVCRARGLDVAEADVVSYLESLPDASLGGLFAAQVVEHLQPATCCGSSSSRSTSCGRARRSCSRR
jgi:hypothetical protein